MLLKALTLKPLYIYIYGGLTLVWLTVLSSLSLSK